MTSMSHMGLSTAWRSVLIHTLQGDLRVVFDLILAVPLDRPRLTAADRLAIVSVSGGTSDTPEMTSSEHQAG